MNKKSQILSSNFVQFQSGQWSPVIKGESFCQSQMIRLVCNQQGFQGCGIITSSYIDFVSQEDNGKNKDYRKARFKVSKAYPTITI